LRQLGRPIERKIVALLARATSTAVSVLTSGLARVTTVTVRRTRLLTPRFTPVPAARTTRQIKSSYNPTTKTSLPSRSGESWTNHRGGFRGSLPTPTALTRRFRQRRKHQFTRRTAFYDVTVLQTDGKILARPGLAARWQVRFTSQSV